jgi:hypothetical protein
MMVEGVDGVEGYFKNILYRENQFNNKEKKPFLPPTTHHNSPQPSTQ